MALPRIKRRPQPEPSGPRSALDYASDRRALRPNNRPRLLVNGDQAFLAMLEAIRGATCYVHLETYILQDDVVGQLFQDALLERAGAGVAVRLLYDAFGSISLPDRYMATLRKGGAEVLEYRPLKLRNLGRWSRRDHRKILVVDGTIGFTGGLNLGKEYVPSYLGGGGWRDTHVQLAGPVVSQLDTMFRTIWHLEGGAPYEQPAPGPAPIGRNTPGHDGVIVGSNHRGRRTEIRRQYLDAIRQARDYVYIANAYFVPDRGIVRALKRAAKRGIDVRVITSENSDVKLVQYASMASFKQLMTAGVKIHLWPKTNMHAKTALVDGMWSTVGSYNLDFVSLFQNLEVVAVVLGDHFGSHMQDMFAADFEQCRELHPGTWRKRGKRQRFLEWLCYKLRRWL